MKRHRRPLTVLGGGVRASCSDDADQSIKQHSTVVQCEGNYNSQRDVVVLSPIGRREAVSPSTTVDHSIASTPAAVVPVTDGELLQQATAAQPLGWEVERGEQYSRFELQQQEKRSWRYQTKLVSKLIGEAWKAFKATEEENLAQSRRVDAMRNPTAAALIDAHVDHTAATSTTVLVAWLKMSQVEQLVRDEENSRSMLTALSCHFLELMRPKRDQLILFCKEDSARQILEHRFMFTVRIWFVSRRKDKDIRGMLDKMEQQLRRRYYLKVGRFRLKKQQVRDALGESTNQFDGKTLRRAYGLWHTYAVVADVVRHETLARKTLLRDEVEIAKSLWSWLRCDDFWDM